MRLQLEAVSTDHLNTQRLLFEEEAVSIVGFLKGKKMYDTTIEREKKELVEQKLNQLAMVCNKIKGQIQ